MSETKSLKEIPLNEGTDKCGDTQVAVIHEELAEDCEARRLRIKREELRGVLGKFFERLNGSNES